MSEIDLASVMTLAEWSKKFGGREKLQKIIEVLTQFNSAMSDAQFKEANKLTSFLTTRRKFLPVGSEVNINEGAPVTQSRVEPFEEQSCVIIDWNEIDDILIQLAGSEWKQARFDEDIAHVHGLRQRFSQRLFYGSKANNAKQLDGLGVRRGTLSNAETYDNAGGNASNTSNKTSMFFIKWGADAFHCFYPKGMANKDYMGLGIGMEDKGKHTLIEGASNELRRDIWRSKFSLQFGFVMRDERAVKVLRNISTTSIDGIDDFSVDEENLIDIMTSYYEDFGNVEGLVCYTSAAVWAQLAKRARNSSHLTLSEWDGKRILNFWGVPIRLDQQVSITEETIV